MWRMNEVAAAEGGIAAAAVLAISSLVNAIAIIAIAIVVTTILVPMIGALKLLVVALLSGYSAAFRIMT
jgi:hypothetical protein